MGMSSSQARLLNMTARMHQIEYKAAKLEAQKLQMANESRRVYDNYLKALDAKKIQFMTLNSKGSVDYADATLAGLENAILHDNDILASTRSYLLQNTQTNEVYLTSKVAEALGFDTEFPASKEAYLALHESEIPKVEVTQQVPDYTNIISVTPVENGTPTIGTHNVTTYSYSMDAAQIAAIPTSQITCNQNARTYWTSTGTVSAPDSITPGSPSTGPQFINSITQKNTVPSGYIGVYTAADLASVHNGQSYILMNDIDLSSYIANNLWAGIELCGGTFDGNGHKITGLSQMSLFSLIGGTTVQNLGIEGADITKFGEDEFGILAYQVDECTIDNCWVTGYLDTADKVGGGIAGEVLNGTGVTISNCWSDVTLVETAPYCSGGILGFNSGTVVITNCYTNQNNIYSDVTTSGGEHVTGCHTNDTTYNHSTPTMGTIDGPNATEDIKKYFAFQMYQSDYNTTGKTYTECYNQLNTALGNDAYKYISLSSMIGDANEEAMIRHILNGGYDDADLYTSSDYTITNTKSAGQFNVQEHNVPAVHTATAGNRDDIVNSLAYAVYQTKISNGSITNE